MRKFIISAIFVFLFSSGSAFSQNGITLSNVLASKKLTYNQAAFLILSVYDDDAWTTWSFKELKEQGFVNRDLIGTEIITLKEFAQFCTFAWDIKGGLFLKITKKPRYVFRQMRADGIFPRDSDPDDSLTGYEAVNIVTNCLDVYKLKNVEDDEGNEEGTVNLENLPEAPKPTGAV